MSKFLVPDGYRSVLSIYETQTAIGLIHKLFEANLSDALNLKRVSAPLFVNPDTGLNDDLNGYERAVVFDVKETGENAAVVHSLAKWKRMALHKYGFSAGEGIYTDMNAIRRDEEMDNIHSIYVDQWDWERIITKADRNIPFLKKTVDAIVAAICKTQEELKAVFPALKSTISKKVSYVTTQELEDMYPHLTPKERENTYLSVHKTAFIMQIGGELKSGKKHDGRAPDYDDWDLNGDILFYNEVLKEALEISSMGIRVDEASLVSQLKRAGAEKRSGLPFHKALLNGELPLTMGGGIGQSRLSMILLEKAHIGEVQVSVWDKNTLDSAEKVGVYLL